MNHKHKSAISFADRQLPLGPYVRCVCGRVWFIEKLHIYEAFIKHWNECRKEKE